jgi:hypothetical protein
VQERDGYRGTYGVEGMKELGEEIWGRVYW